MVELSKRLNTIASYIPENKRVADIGGDHAWLLIALALSDELSYGIVGELNRGPCENARQRVEKYGCSSRIDVRQGDGLSVCQADEIDVVVIAGMGGSLIRHILETGKHKLSQVQRLVLQPNIAGRAVRWWLYENGWHLVEETLVEEQEIIYEVLVAEKGTRQIIIDDNFSSQLFLDIGPLLWKHRHPLLKKRMQEELAKKNRVHKELTRSHKKEVLTKRIQLQQEIEEWERMIGWLSMEIN